MQLDWIADALLVLALFLVVVGVALIYAPAGFIVAGLGIAGMAIRMMSLRGGAR